MVPQYWKDHALSVIACGSEKSMLRGKRVGTEQHYLGCQLLSVALMHQGKVGDLARAAPASPCALLAINTFSVCDAHQQQ